MKKTLKIAGLIALILFGGLVQLFAQQSAIIKGRVIDSQTKEPLPGVNVVEIDKNERFLSGTIADFNGNFVLQVSNIENSIQFSYIGYDKITEPLKGRTTIDVEMVSGALSINELTVSASKMSNDGIIPIRDQATAVGRIEFDDLQTVMGSSVEEMIQGRIAGVDISAISGDPGAGMNIRIRGTASLNGDNEPLIVINGIPYNPSNADFDYATADLEAFGTLIDVAPEDIESIEVLKDAASTAIWGSKAANGVLMIKTKRGIKSAPIFEYTFKNTIGWEPQALPMLKGGQYSSLIQAMHYNVDRNTFYNVADPTQTDPSGLGYHENEIFYNPAWPDYKYYSQEVDWISELTKVSNSMQHVFSVRGGGDKSRYNMSVSYTDEDGTTINNGLKKLNLRSSLDYDLSTKLRFTTDVLYTRYDQHNTYEKGVSGLRTVAYTRMPNVSIYEFDSFGNMLTDEYFTPQETLQGSVQSIYNPVALANLGVNKTLKNNARAAFTLRYRILDDLILQSTVTLDVFDSRNHAFLPYDAIGGNYDNDLTNYASENFSKKTAIYSFHKAIYTPKLGDNHTLTVLGQFDTEQTTSRAQGLETNKSASEEFQQPVGDKNIVGLSENFSEYRSLGLFAMAHYKFKDTYLLSIGAKYEGVSKYSPESRWGFFPTVSGAWRISEESFLKNAIWINDFRLRLSWGKSGNAAGGNDAYYNIYNTSTSYGYMGMQGVAPGAVEFTKLKWENIEQINPGISFYGLNNRLNVEMDYYKKTTTDLYLGGLKIPTSSGFNSITVNEGSMENRGYEVFVDYSIIKKKDLIVSVNFNLAHNSNIVLNMPEHYPLEYGNMLDNGNYKISIEPGKALGGFFGYNYLGVYDGVAVVKDKDGYPVYGLNKTAPLEMIMGNTSYVFQPGDAKYQDVNYDGKIDELDLVYLGDLNPDLMGGFGTKVFYKGLTLNTLFSFKLGHQIINQTRMDTEKMYNYNNQSTATLSYWRTEGDGRFTDIPRPLYNTGYNWLGSGRFVENGDHLRLKSISLSYNFPRNWLKQTGIGLTDARFYVTAYNIATWTNYSGQDPDVGLPTSPASLPKDGSRTPPSQRVILGLNVKF